MTAKGPEAFRTISEVADDLDLPQHVLRFWETRFSQIKPMKRGGGRRYYRPQDVELLRGIRVLLYGEGYTIKGVQRLLKERGVKVVMAVGRGEASVDIDGPDLGAARAVSAGGAAEQGDNKAAKLFSKLGLKKNPDKSDEVDLPFDPTRPPAKGLSEQDVEKLHGTLFELLECKRMLDQVK
ncbi:MAG: MerR family transcriptional regulator [Alphaproteobacteria bacterium]